MRLVDFRVRITSRRHRGGDAGADRERRRRRGGAGRRSGSRPTSSTRASRRCRTRSSGSSCATARRWRVRRSARRPRELGAGLRRAGAWRLAGVAPCRRSARAPEDARLRSRRRLPMRVSRSGARRGARTGPTALVRRGDPERWRTAMAAPPAARPGLMALYAFNLEIARAPWVASEPLLAEIRLAWWREAVAEIYDGKPPRRHEVVAAARARRSRRRTCRGGCSTR